MPSKRVWCTMQKCTEANACFNPTPGSQWALLIGFTVSSMSRAVVTLQLPSLIVESPWRHKQVTFETLFLCHPYQINIVIRSTDCIIVKLLLLIWLLGDGLIWAFGSGFRSVNPVLEVLWESCLDWSPHRILAPCQSGIQQSESGPIWVSHYITIRYHIYDVCEKWSLRIYVMHTGSFERLNSDKHF